MYLDYEYFTGGHGNAHADVVVQFLVVKFLIEGMGLEFSLLVARLPACASSRKHVSSASSHLASASIALRSSMTLVIVGRSAGSCSHMRSTRSIMSSPQCLRRLATGGLRVGWLGKILRSSQPAGPPLLLGAHGIVDPMLIAAFPGICFLRSSRA